MEALSFEEVFCIEQRRGNNLNVGYAKCSPGTPSNGNRFVFIFVGDEGKPLVNMGP